MNPKSGSSSTAASPVREGGGGRMDKGHKPTRLYQVWKGSNVSVSLSLCVNFVF
jgi:hypothetical protein